MSFEKISKQLTTEKEAWQIFLRCQKGVGSPGSALFETANRVQWRRVDSSEVTQRSYRRTVSVNCMDAAGNMVPFGGFKQSGIGRDQSLHAFDKYSSLKTVWIKY